MGMRLRTAAAPDSPASPRSRLRRAAGMGLAVSSLLSVVGMGLAATPAAAASPNCQNTYARLYFNGSGSPASWNCAGSHLISVRATRFSAGGWSGAVYFTDRDPKFFCDFDSFSLNNAPVREVYLNVTKPSRCQ